MHLQNEDLIAIILNPTPEFCFTVAAVSFAITVSIFVLARTRWKSGKRANTTAVPAAFVQALVVGALTTPVTWMLGGLLQSHTLEWEKTVVAPIRVDLIILVPGMILVSLLGAFCSLRLLFVSPPGMTVSDRAEILESMSRIRVLLRESGQPDVDSYSDQALADALVATAPINEKRWFRAAHIRAARRRLAGTPE